MDFLGSKKITCAKTLGVGGPDPFCISPDRNGLSPKPQFGYLKSLKIHFAPTSKPWDTIVCWNFQGNHHSRVSYVMPNGFRPSTVRPVHQGRSASMATNSSCGFKNRGTKGTAHQFSGSLRNALGEPLKKRSALPSGFPLKPTKKGYKQKDRPSPIFLGPQTETLLSLPYH